MAKRKRQAAAFKAKVALEALKGEQKWPSWPRGFRSTRR